MVAACARRIFRPVTVIYLFYDTAPLLRHTHTPEVSEPLTVGAQYLTRYNTSKKFVRATRPALDLYDELVLNGIYE